MSARVSRFLLVIFAVLLAIPPLALSQGIGGAISGVVKDESGAAVAAAVVKLTNAQTGQVRTVSTDNDGRYTVREVPPGAYDLTVERPGFNTAKVSAVRISVAQVARLDDITLNVATIGQEITVSVPAEVALTDVSSPTLSTSFNEKQIRELPVLTRDINNLALLAPGVFSVRTFSFASTLVPFAANGSRGRDNNFIIDSVDNNEPLFGGAAAQFTNTDLFVEYRILTNQYKAEYGRNSGSVVNIITERGGNQFRGSAFFFGQHDSFNASTRVESVAQVIGGTTRFYETQAGATLGGPVQKEKSWFFVSYQWDRARNDLSPVFPVVSTAPTVAGLQALQAFRNNPTVAAMLALDTVSSLPNNSNAPCGRPGSNLPLFNPCTISGAPGVPVFNLAGTAVVANVPFGTFLVPQASVFDVRDHQFSGRFDRRLGQRDDVYVRYLFDDLRTPRTLAGAPGEVGFADFGLYPEWRISFMPRTQNLGLFWTRAWATALHELRGSFTRISSQTGPFDFVDEATRNGRPAVTVFDTFATNTGAGGTGAGAATFLAAFSAAGRIFTMGRDTRPTTINSNIFQLQDNFSWSKGRHGLKVGGNIVRTQTNVRQIPSDLGQYFYLSFSDFVNNLPVFAWQRFGNFRGRGGDVLPVRELGQFYFFQDDIRVSSNFTVSLGIRYENYGQALNKVPELNPGFGSRVNRDDNNIAPRVGLAWSPDGKIVFRGGYGVYYNPTVFNIALITWQGGRISPFVFGFPQNVFPARPFGFDPATATDPFAGVPCNSVTSPTSAFECTTADTVSPTLVNPLVQNYSVSVQRQFTRDLLIEVSYVGSKGRSLFQRLDRNPNLGYQIQTVVSAACGTPPCVTLRNRRNPARGAISEVTNGALSSYHALQVAATHRLSSRWKVPMAITGAYTWSHMIDNASEIFGPGLKFTNKRDIGDLLNSGGSQTVEAITPFPQNSSNPVSGERGNSSFDRRHRVAVSVLALLPSPASGVTKWVFGNWQVNGLFTSQSGQPFTPLNGIGNCIDAGGDGQPTNDRPLVGNPNVPANLVAVLVDCTRAAGGYVRPGTTAPVFSQAEALQNSRFVQAPLNVLGNAGRNILIGPNLINLDMAIFKNFPWGDRRNFQFRVEGYNVLNRANPGNLLGNVFTSDAQPVPAIAFQPGLSGSRITGVIPENNLDAVDPSCTAPACTTPGLFLSQRFMNTGARRFQLGLKLLF